MRRTMNALAMTAATLSLAGSPAYAQETPQAAPNPNPTTEGFEPECRSVIDQTTDNVVDTDLRMAIAKMAKNHVTVRVQILDTDNNFNFRSEQDISDYQATLKAICPANGVVPDPEAEEAAKSNDVIDVTIDSNTRLFHVDDDADKISDVREAGFIEDLKDEDSPYQQDVAELLKDASVGEKFEYWLWHKKGWAILGGSALLLMAVGAAVTYPGSVGGRGGRGGSSSGSSFIFLGGGDYGGGGFSGSDSGGGGGDFGGSF